MRLIFATNGLASILLSSTALGQGAPPSPSEREQEEFEPVGGRVGGFILHPSVDARIEYDDNILALPSGAADDMVLTVRGAVAAESLWQRHSLEADAYIQQSLHGEFTSEDALEAGARMRGRLDINRDTSARGVVSFDSLAEDRSSITSVLDAREPTRYRRFDALASFAHDFDPVQIIASAQVVSLDFDDALDANGKVIEQDFRDSVYVRSTISAAMDVSPRVAAILRGQVDRLSYSGEPDVPDPFDRDTTGYAIETGLRLELSNLLFGEFRAGVLHRETDDPSVDGLTGLSFGANLTWNVTPLTTVRLFADRQVEEGGSQLVSGNVRSQARVTAEHELLRNLIIQGEASFARIDTLGQVDESADEYGVSVEATYKVDRNIRLYARASRFERFGDDQFFRDFSRNRVMAGVRVVF